MQGKVFIILLLIVLGESEARLPKEFSKLFALSDEMEKKESIEEAVKNLGLGEVERYKPAPIQKVECHVEFQVTKRVPGRCTKLAGSIPACQAEKYIGINYSECN